MVGPLLVAKCEVGLRHARERQMTRGATDQFKLRGPRFIFELVVVLRALLALAWSLVAVSMSTAFLGQSHFFNAVRRACSGLQGRWHLAQAQHLK
ncbi:hypothetical protein NDU88_004104 [Pleurodeles waltl]|uniref:Uncharacterized protein n=1 Tax=Pleurodeles waltl TaxID=8319 RepID=A0AAV7PE60_PLEWA|nr:hypothetical protein NDU88_004104 [Pleurodeles waltl]